MKGSLRRSSLVKREASELRNEIRFTRPASRESMAMRAVEPRPPSLLGMTKKQEMREVL